MKNWGIVISGGRGERLWPLSVEEKPKQFHKLYKNKSLLELTLERVFKVFGENRTIVVTTSEQEKDVRKICKSFRGINVSGEPEGRNTAIAIGYGIIRNRLNDEDLIGVFPSDHLIKPLNKFKGAVKNALELAREGYIVLIGVKPEEPFSGYGYIVKGKKIEVPKIKAWRVKRFVEKPLKGRAKRLIAQGSLWNSGIFVMKVGIYLKEMERFLPETFEILQMLKNEKSSKKVKQIYSKAPKISFDYGVVEKSKRIAVIEADFNWSDVGNWNAIGTLLKKGENGNRIYGKAVFIDSKNNAVFSSDNRPVGLLGIDNAVVVSTEKGVLVVKKERANDVKYIAKIVQEKMSK